MPDLLQPRPYSLCTLTPVIVDMDKVEVNIHRYVRAWNQEGSLAN